MTTVLVTLACGHSGRANAAHRPGDWISCWALMHPERGCQTQRKVVRVTEDMLTWEQGALW